MSKYDYSIQQWDNDGRDKLYRKLARAIIRGLITEDEALLVIASNKA